MARGEGEELPDLATLAGDSGDYTSGYGPFASDDFAGGEDLPDIRAQADQEWEHLLLVRRC